MLPSLCLELSDTRFVAKSVKKSILARPVANAAISRATTTRAAMTVLNRLIPVVPAAMLAVISRAYWG